MSARRAVRGDAVAGERASTLLPGVVYVAAMSVVAAVAAWPIYRSGSFVLLVVVAGAVGAALASVGHLRRWGGVPTVSSVIAAVAILGVPLAVPSRLATPVDLLGGFADLGSGALFGWKDLLTVELPVGAYRNLLVPALIVFLGGVCAALRLSWRPTPSAYAAVPVALAMVTYGLLFGRTSVSAPLMVGPVSLAAPMETGAGASAIVASVVWMAWRARRERVRALDRAAASTGIHLSRRGGRPGARRTALAAAMVLTAVVVAVAVVPAAAAGRERAVLRSATGPELDLSREVSPLSSYRADFTDPRADQVLFTVSGDGPLPERVRLATLDSYDGQVYRSGGSDAAGTAAFVRMPADREVTDGQQVRMTVTVGALEGVWMPTAGRIESMRFDGPRASALADRFYYADAAEAGVQTAGGGLQQGDSYTLTAADQTASLAPDARGPGVRSEVEAPPNLRAWVTAHSTGADGASLAGLVTLLRERGYLSHALSIDAGSPPSWVRELGEYSFQPSASGHSLARIDALFGRLLEREADPTAASSGDMVAAIGDDEQFAVAVALVAEQLGFPARVVVGARLSSSDPSLSVCTGGSCRAQDLTAWTEVRTADGTWAALDVTPQHTVPPSRDRTQLRDPENATEVRPDGVADVVPPPPLQQDSARGDAPPPADAGLAWLWPVLRTSGFVLLALLILCGPFLWVMGVKAARRRARRTAADPVVRIAGGWEEYVDAAADAGRPAPPDLTRHELASAFGTPSAVLLAAGADRAAFSGAAPTEAEAEEYWRLVDDDRRALRRDAGLWQRARAAVSLRSFLRSLVPVGRSGNPPGIAKERRRATRVRPST